METLFLCTDCGGNHSDPADARLGHLVLCLDCEMLREPATMIAGGAVFVESLAA